MSQELSKQDLRQFKTQLFKRKKELTDLSHSTTENRKAVSLDQQKIGRISRIDAIQQQAMAKGIEHRRHTELNRIEQAIERLKNGEYGYCLRCDELIDKKRLIHDPSLPLCINCAKNSHQAN